MINKTGYGLLHNKSGKILGVSTQNNDNDCDGISVSYELSNYSDIMWVVDSKLRASYVRLNSTEWYNADYDSPINPFDPDELSVVKVEVKVDIEEPSFIPTYEEFMKMKYNTEGRKGYNPEWYEMIMSQHRYGSSYSFYELEDYYGENNK